MKRLVFISMFMLFLMCSFGQSGLLSISYDIAEQPLLDVFRFQKMNCFQLTLTGNFKEKTTFFAINENICIDGKLQTERDTSLFNIKLDTLKITAISQLLGPDSVRIALYSGSGIHVDKHYSIPTHENMILMETYLDAENKQMGKIPLIAFTSGIEKKATINGKIYDIIDYCGLRDAKVSPEYWLERFGISNYIYFEFELIDKEK